MAAIVCLLEWRPRAMRRPRGRALLSVFGVVACFVAGYALFELALIEPLRPSSDIHASALPYHSIAHPLVLGLALPENAVSRREGIEWNDHVGLTLAHRVDPAATYLSREYDRALFRYYAGLWRADPLDMFNVYQAKHTSRGVSRSTHS